ncbi:MAG: ABC transporter permease, partial [Acidimicrobiia bacterium]|nr:ABC transporter permease [Acidimicrobiia bacterium]
MWKAGLKSVLAHKVRLALTAMAIVLGVGLVAGTFIFTDTIDRQFDGLFDDIFSGLDVSVRKASGDFGANSEPFDASVLDAVSDVDGVAVVEGGVDTFSSQVLDRDGEPIGGQGPPTLGFSWGVEPSLNPLKIAAENGRPPTGPGEVVIDINTANVGEFEVGDMITVVNFAGPEQFELVGIASFGESDTLLGATLTAFELDEARRLFGFGDEFTGLSMTAVEGISSDELASRVQAVLPADLEAVTGQTQQNEQAEEIDSALGFLNIGLLAFAGVAVFVGGFIIQNTFRIIVAQRTRELALMRAIGATGSQVTRLVLIEAFITAVIASVVGIGFGMVMALGIRGLMNAVGFGLPPGSLVLAPRTIIVGLIVGVGLTVVSGLFPARKAAKVPPVAAMREEAATMPRRSLRRRAIIGSSISALGAALLLFGLFGGIDNAISLVGAGAAVLFIGISVLAPLAAKPLADVIGAPLPRFFGVSGTLAKENTKRKPRRTASTASALMIGVALVAFFSIFGASTKASIEDTISELFPADLTVQSVNPSPDGTPLAFSPA